MPLAALAASSCDWREFDEVLSKAPVLSLGAPEGFGARDVGKVILPLAVPPSRIETVSARFLIAGTETPSLGIVELDKAGRARTTVATKVEIMDLAGEAKASVKSAVQLADGRIVLGTPSYSANPQQVTRGRVYYLSLTEGANGTLFRITRGGEVGERIFVGLGVTAGRFSGAAEDVAVASQTDVVLYEGGNEAVQIVANPACDLAIDPNALEKYRFRALVAGQLIEGGAEELAVAVPREAGGTGRVVILSRGGAGLDCPVILESPAKLPRFGTSLVAGDFTGDGKLDLLVGAPPLRAYVFPGPFAPGKPALPSLELRHPTVPDSGATGDFGYRVLGLDVDGVAGPEILISAPEAAVGSDTGVGRVYAFRRDGGAFLTEIGDNSPESEASFGYALAGLRFAPKGCGAERSVLVVGAIKEVFTFFRVPGGPPDPRCL